MPEGGLTSASFLRYLLDKTAGRNNLNEWESNAVFLGETWTNQCLVDNFVSPQWIRSESEYVWTGEFDMNTLWTHNVWTRIFSYPEKKKLRILKYLDKWKIIKNCICTAWEILTTEKILLFGRFLYNTYE